MLVSNGTLLLRYEEQVHRGMRLGRHLELDSRSLRFQIGPELLRTRPKPSEWLSPIPVLDQGELGSCTGNATTYHLGHIHRDDLASCVLDGVHLDSSDAEKAEAFAVAAYSLATRADGFAGVFPPEDTGSSGLGCGRAMKKAGLVAGYRWALSTRGVGTMLSRGGILIGMPWLEAFFEPSSADGFIDTGEWWRSPVAGGHEIYGEALETWSDDDPHGSVVRCRNSWGGSWGDHGSFRLRLSTYERLRSSMDIKQFLSP